MLGRIVYMTVFVTDQATLPGFYSSANSRSTLGERMHLCIPDTVRSATGSREADGPSVGRHSVMVWDIEV
jgi:hypothetical protein